MSFFPKDAGGGARTPRELIPQATHEAYCYGVVDIGTQERKPYLGKPKDPNRALILFFEFTEVKHVFKEENGEEPMVKSQQYSYFTDEKSALAKLCKGWLGKKVEDVDFDKLAGTPASITITHEKGNDEKIYDNMTAISPLSAKLIALMPPQHNKTMNFSIMMHGFDSPEFAALYPWVQNKIKESPEYKEYLAGPPQGSTLPEDCPFPE